MTVLIHMNDQLNFILFLFFNNKFNSHDLNINFLHQRENS